MNTPRWFARIPGGALLGVVVATLVLWPGVLSPRARLIGDEGLDVWSHAWGIRWFYEALAAGTLPWRVTGLAWPQSGVLWYIDPLGALLSLPVQLFAGNAAGHNAILFFQVMLATWAGWGMARAMGGRGWLAGLALGTAPTLLAEIHNGTVEACWLGLVPLAGWAAARGSRWAGPLVGLASFATPYHGIGAALLVGAVLLFEPHAPTRRAWRVRLIDTATAAAWAALIALPAFLLLKASIEDPSGLAKKAIITMNLPVFRINAVDPIAFVQAGDFWTVDLYGALTTPFRRTPYLGLSLLGLSAWSLWRHRRFTWLLLPATILATLSLGPYLWHDGDFVQTQGGDRLALPFAFVLRSLGVAMDHPLRFIGGTITVLAVLADRLTAPWPVGGIAAVCALVAVEHLSWAPNVWPIHTADASLPAVYESLDEGAIIDLPAARGRSIATNRYLYWHGLHGHPIPYGHKVGPDLPNMNPTLRKWAALSRTGPSGPLSPPTETGFSTKKAVRSLGKNGFRWVVLHGEMLATEALAAKHRKVLTEALGPPVFDQEDTVWAIPSTAR